MMMMMMIIIIIIIIVNIYGKNHDIRAVNICRDYDVYKSCTQVSIIPIHVGLSRTENILVCYTHRNTNLIGSLLGGVRI